MPFKAHLRVFNPTANEHRGIVYAGTIFEARDPFSRMQNLSAIRDTRFTVPPGHTRIVEVESWCMNSRLNPPHGTAMLPTALAAKAYGSQQAAWDDLNSRR
jgi:hypothetical protein